MPDLLLIDAVGTCIAIDLGDLDQDDAQAVRDAWADAIHRDTDIEPSATVTPRGGARPHLLSSLSQQVTLAAIEQRKGELWMLHAAAVATPTGETVVLVGPSGRGKTTAAGELGRHFGYVSDETVAVDAEGRVWPYRKPLSVIGEPGAPKSQPAPSRLGLRPVPDADLRVAAVVLLDRGVDGPETPQVESVDLGDALPELVAQSSHLSKMPAPLRQIAVIADATGGIRRVRYREAGTLPAVIGDLATPATTPQPVTVYTPPESRPAPTPDDDRPRFERTRPADMLRLHDPDRIALLSLDDRGRGVLRVLAGVAPALWRAAAGATLDDLVAAAIAAYGEPDEGDAAAAVEAAVEELCAAGILARRVPTDGARASGVGSDATPT